MSDTLDRLSAIHDAATKGPFWTCHLGSYDHVNAEGQDDPVAIVPRCADAAFIAAARNTYAALLGVARAAEHRHMEMPPGNQFGCGCGWVWCPIRAALAALDAAAKEAV